MIEEITPLISTVGFPIAVCMWFMLRTEKVINNNTKALNSVREMQTICFNRKLK